MTVPSVSILLVDDEPRNLETLEAILDDPDYRLLRADSPERALRLLLDFEVAAIVLDVQMPGMSGFELAQLIKGTKRYRQIPILFLTAYLIDDQDMIAGYGAGAVDYLTKPINPLVLRHKVAVFADLFRKSRALAELNERLEERVRERTAELERSEAALKRAARQKDEFLAVLAHELRNPLAPLRTGLDLLLRIRPPEPPVGRTLEAMNRQLDHMVRLIDDLMDVSRITSGKLELKRESVDLATVVDRALDGAQTFFEQRRQTVDIDVARDIPALVDPVRVVQILVNLLHNASKFTPAGGQIRVELGQEAGRALIRVVDTGVGIPPAQVGRVFEKFAHIDQPGAGGRGLGIGLALARDLAEMHGGSLTASSAGDGRGTTFTLALPILGGAAIPPSAPRPEAAPAPATSRLRIVLVEDNDDVANSLAAWLEHIGHVVSIARSGPAGVELVREVQPDIVLCDLGLPDMDGIQVCRAIRAMSLPREPVMVAITGWGRDDDRQRTADAGFRYHLVKPVAPDKLQRLLDDYSASRAGPT